jgi:lipopolysaccharide biosynthesis regulator YciM
MEIISQYPELIRFGEFLIAEIKRGEKAPSVEEAAKVLKIDAVRLRNLIYKCARCDWRAMRAELERELVI